MFFSSHNFRSVFFILLFLVSGQNLRAQTINNGLKFSTIKEVKLEDSNNFSVILQLENTTNDTINARLGLKIPSAIRSYSQDNLQIKINPNKKAFIPMQFTVSKSQMAGKLDLEFNIIDFLSKKEIGKSVTSVVVLQKRNIKIFPVQSNIFYRQEGDSIHYELKVMNMGNQAEEILLTNVLPDFRGSYTYNNKRLIVEAFQEKIVQF